VEIMDLSFAVQALCVEHIAKTAGTLENKVYVAPAEIDRYIAEYKLKSMGCTIDALTPEQDEYLHSWGAE
jgi:adenosylhomocysteinase